MQFRDNLFMALIILQMYEYKVRLVCRIMDKGQTSGAKEKILTFPFGHWPLTFNLTKNVKDF